MLKNRFCHFFFNYGGALEGQVCLQNYRDNKYRRSPIPKGGLEIPIVLIVNKDKAPSSVFNRMKEYLQDYYIVPEKMIVSSAQTEAEERLAADGLDEYGPEEENTLEMEEQNHPSDIGEDNIIVIKG